MKDETYSVQECVYDAADRTNKTLGIGQPKPEPQNVVVSPQIAADKEGLDPYRDQ